MEQVSSWARRSVGVLALSGLVLAGCAGSGSTLREVGQTGLPGHLEMVGEDASLVVSVNSLSDRMDAIVTSKAYKRIKAWLESQGEDAELLELAEKSDEATRFLKEVLSGRVTMALYELPGSSPEADSEFVVIADADVRAMLQELAKLDQVEGEPAPQLLFREVQPEIFEAKTEGSSEPLFVAQVGATGVVSSRPELIQSTLARGRALPAGGRVLVDGERFKALTQGLRRDANLFVYLRDWRTADSEWDALMGEAPANSEPRGAAGTLMLADGAELELLVEFDERDLQGEELQQLLPALRGTETTLKIPGVLPSDTLGYLGFALQMDKVIAWLTATSDPMGLGLPPEGRAEFEGIVKDFLACFQGEFGIAFLGLPTDQPASLMLGVPAPEVALLARLSDVEAEERVLKITQGLLGLAQMASGSPEGTFGPPRTEVVEGATLQILPLAMDPGVEVAYGVRQGYLFLGTRSGVAAALKGQAAGPGKSLAQAAGHPAVQRGFAASSNYAAYLHLKGLYALAEAHFGPMLGLMTGGLVSPGGDNIAAILTEVFQHAGASFLYREGASTLRIYLSAQDLP